LVASRGPSFHSAHWNNHPEADFSCEAYRDVFSDFDDDDDFEHSDREAEEEEEEEDYSAQFVTVHA